MNGQLLQRFISFALLMFCFCNDEAHAKTISKNPRSAILIAESEQFIAQDAWNSVALYSWSETKPLRRFTAASEINEIALTSDKHLLLIACESGEVSVWHIETAIRLWSKLPPQSGLDYIYGADLSSNGKSLVVCNSRDFAVIFDSLTGQQIGKVSFPPMKTNIMSAALSPDGTKGVLVDLGGHLFTFDTKTGPPKDTGLTGAWPVRYSRDGKYAVLRSSNSGTEEQLRVVSIQDLSKKDVGQFSHVGHIKPTQGDGFLATALVGGLQHLSGYDEKCATVGIEYVPNSEQLKEVWRLPISDAENRTDFDVGRLIGVSTDYRLVTRLIDLRTGKARLTIDNSVNYRERVMTYTSADLRDEAVQFWTTFAWAGGILVLIFVGWLLARFRRGKKVG